MSRIIESGPDYFAAELMRTGRRRAWISRDSDTGAYRASDPLAQEIADFLTADTRDCRDHEAIFLQVDQTSGALFGAFLHCTLRGQAQGGLRRWDYARLEDVLRDGLRLSLGMTRKNALASLWWGGGKGLIACGRSVCDDPGARRDLYLAFGAFVSSLHGCYLTAEDVGTTPTDVAEVYRGTRFVTCLPPEIGGSGNPSEHTAGGVVCAMEAALESLGEGSLAGKTIAIQGMGHTGTFLTQRLLERGAGAIVASELSDVRCAEALEAFRGAPVDIRVSSPGDASILTEACDILAPCALGGILDDKTIPQIRAKIVCGSANNPLAEQGRDDVALAERDILYVPDYVANRMGIVSCGNEQYGKLADDPQIARHLSRDWPEGVYQITLHVLDVARREGITTVAAANRLADERAQELHPIWGDRARRIVVSRACEEWVQG